MYKASYANVWCRNLIYSHTLDAIVILCHLLARRKIFESGLPFRSYWLKTEGDFIVGEHNTSRLFRLCPRKGISSEGVAAGHWQFWIQNIQPLYCVCSPSTEIDRNIPSVTSGFIVRKLIKMSQLRFVLSRHQRPDKSYHAAVLVFVALLAISLIGFSQ